MLNHLRRLIQYNGLLWTLAQAEIRARHRQTLLGILWAGMQPLSIMVVFLIVFSIFVRIPVEGVPYPLFVYTGLWLWLFFANSLSAGLPSIVGNMNLVTKANFPREVIPLSKVLTVAVDFVIGAGLLVVLLVVYGIRPSLSWLAVPGLLLIHLSWTVGLVLMGSALYVVQRDLGSLLPLILQVWMFLSPVIYPVAVIPDSYRTLYLLNPMAMILEVWRGTLLYGTWPAPGLLIPSAMVALIALTLGYVMFKTLEWKFADVM